MAAAGIGTGSVPPLPDFAQCPAEAQNSTIQTPKQWSDEKKAQRDLDKRFAVHYSEWKGFYRTFCDRCGIGIGPAQFEQALYFYPVVNAGIYLRDDEKFDDVGRALPPQEHTDVLRVCGSCAKQLELPLARRVIAPQDWTMPPRNLAALTLVDFQDWLFAQWHTLWQKEIPQNIPCPIKSSESKVFSGSVKTQAAAPPPAVLPKPVVATSHSRTTQLLSNVRRARALSQKILRSQPAAAFAV
jgi:hypothetical protein